MELKGSFDSATLSSILQLLCNDQRTGVLRLTDNESEVKVYFKEGSVIYAMGTQNRTQLGHLLTSRGMITVEQLNYCLAVAKQRKNALGKILVDENLISISQLKTIIRQQAEDLIVDLFFWKIGYFDYSDAQIKSDGLIATKLDMMSIILEATRRIDEMSILRKQIPNAKIIFKLSGKVDAQQEIKFNEKEWCILSLVDGSRSVQQLIDTGGYGVFFTYKALNALISLGLIEPGAEAPHEPDKPAYVPGFVTAAYHDILRIIYTGFESELAKWPYILLKEGSLATNSAGSKELLQQSHETQMEKWTSTILEKCKPKRILGHYEPLSNFCLHKSTEFNIQVVEEYLKNFNDPAKGLAVLFKSFKEYTSNILKKALELIGVQPTAQLLREIEKKLENINCNQTDASGKQDIALDIKGIMLEIRRQIEAGRELKTTAEGILAI